MNFRERLADRLGPDHDPADDPAWAEAYLESWVTLRQLRASHWRDGQQQQPSAASAARLAEWEADHPQPVVGEDLADPAYRRRVYEWWIRQPEAQSPEA